MRLKISKGLMNLGVNFPFKPNLNIFFNGATFRNTLSPVLNLKGIHWVSAYFFCLSWLAFIWSLIILTFSIVTYISSAPYSFCPRLLPNTRKLCISYRIGLCIRSSLLLPSDYCYMWIPPMLYVFPSFLQILKHTAIINHLGSEWPFQIDHQSTCGKQYLHLISFPENVVCSTTDERWTWNPDLGQWMLEFHEVVVLCSHKF